ncbi:MAG: ABC transporter permease [Alkalispirochaeta sp.]
MIDLKGTGARVMRRHETYLVILILVFSVVTANIAPAFLTTGNWLSLLRGGAGLGILSLAFFVALIAGGIELSFPAIAISGQYIAVNTLIALGLDNIWLAFAISITIGIVYGLINAFFITQFKIPAMIVTLATFNLFHGGLLEFVGTHSVNVGPLPDTFSRFGRLSIFSFKTAEGTQGLSIFFVILVAAVILTWFILRRTMLGRGIYAVGGDMEGARRAGFNVNRIQYFVYAYVGFLAGIMGIIHVSMIRYSNPNYIADTALLRVIAAVILGGTSITGGRGTITGTMLGVLMITLLDRHLIMLGVSPAWTDFLIGLVIVVGVSSTHLRLKLQKQKQGELVVERAH